MGSPKKLEFASTHLEPIDSEAPTDGGGTISSSGFAPQPSGAWDTEADYILSYFLEGDGGGASQVGSTIPTAADFASTTSFSTRHDPHSSSSDPLHSLRAPATNEDDRRWSELPPPTPAVQFYSHTPQTTNAHHHHQQHHHHQSSTSTRRSNENIQLNHANYKGNPLSQQQPVDGQSKTSPSSSQHPPNPELQQAQSHHQQQYPHASFASVSGQSSLAASLSSMAATLIAGVGPGGMLYNNHYSQQHLHRVASQTSVGSTPPIESPISPAAIIGLGYENLLLPPPGGPFAAPSMPPPVPANHHHPSDSSSSHHQMPHQLPNILPQPHANPLLPHVAAATAGLTPQQLHQQQLLYATAAAHAAAAASRPVESHEKRAQRLERNRESARKSRRRKKERLSALGATVQKLQNAIAMERSRHIEAMVPALRASRTRELAQLLDQSSGNMMNDPAAQEDLLARIIRGSGPSSPIMRSVLDFQYTTLKQMTLPSYQKLLLWFTLRDESYFLAGKEQYAVQQEQQMAASSGGIATATATGATGQNKPWTKVSSKQIGDEMLHGPGGSKAKIPGGSKNKRQNHDDNTDDGSKNPTANAYDAARCWPLFCFELKFSVEQEERFLSTYRQVVANEAILSERRSEMAAAVHTTESLGRVVGSLGHIVAHREEKSYLNILDPHQVCKYQKWLEQNRERVRLGVFPSANGGGTDNEINEVSLQDICRRLNEVLKISTTSLNDPIGMKE